MTSWSLGTDHVADGIRLGFGEGLGIEWEVDALMRAADAADPAAPPAWELAGELDWEEVESIRLIIGAADETGLAVVVARPAGASDHGEDAVVAALVEPTGPSGAEEALLSSEYDADGALRRFGLELWLESGAGKRIAADRSGQLASGGVGALTREVTPLAIRVDGREGRGLHELVRPA
jgi:hypothetical protein